jgi:hypothetical protein
MDRLTANYQGALKRTRSHVADLVGAQWSGLGTYNKSDVPRFLNRALPIVAAGQARAVALTNAYLGRQIGTGPQGVDVAALGGAAVRNGADPTTVYTRPFITVWAALGNGDDLQQAIDSGYARVTSTADMDVALSMRDSMLAFGFALALSDPGGQSQIVAWRRVAESSCCEYCQMLDGVHTGPSQPQPLHNRCGCTAEPITRATADAHPSILDGLLLGLAGAVIGQTLIQEHGELGPVITQNGDSFTTEAEALAGE